MREKITNEDIERFLNGHDPQERIVNFDYKGKDSFITVIYRDENDNKCATTEPFFPFLWATKRACDILREKNGTALPSLMRKYGVWVKKLDVTNNNGEVVEEILDGYIFMFYATKPLPYYSFLDFFKKAGYPVYPDRRKKDGDGKTEPPRRGTRDYLIVPPVEQYMISSGKRMFKGYEDYNDTLRMIFDLETTGLDTERDRIEQFGIRFNRPVKYNGEYMEFSRTYRVEGDTEEEKNISELQNIKRMLSIIYTFRPDVISAHNGENFDWNIIIGACKRLGTSIEEISAKYFNGESITKSNRDTILKLGGEIETFRQTIVPRTIITDSLHAVRRAQAIDSNMASSGLKYVTKYSNIVKPDRVYIPGDKISEIWNDTIHRFRFCEEDGDWYIYDPSYTPKDEKPDPSITVGYFQSLKDSGFAMASASTMSLVKDTSATAEEMYAEYIRAIKERNKERLVRKGKDSDIFRLYTKNFIMDGYHEVSGQYIAERYLLDDLWECDKVEHRYNGTNFLICKMLPVPFQKCCTMGTAGQWRSLMMAWSYENDLAIPMFGERKTFTGGLSRLLKVGYVPDVAKFDYNSLYPSIVLTWAVQTSKDLMGIMLAFLEHVLTQREKYKNLKKVHGKEKEKYKEKLKDCADVNQRQELKEKINIESEAESANDKKQLPLKILGNSFFGSYGAPNVFPWGDSDCAERTTCTGRQALRLMIGHFSNIGKKYSEMINGDNLEDYNYTPIVGDTDGFNFQLPKKYRYTEENPYISPGLSRETENRKKYDGFKADVAEFNDLFMRDFHYNPLSINKMGLGIDEVVSSTINFSRKNYADSFPEEPFPNDVKMVGNTIKSKKMPEYIAQFLVKGIRLLLQKRGQDFLNEYYSYIERIYNYRIPLRSIASKGKIKKSINEYIEDCKTITKSGNPKSRQAWMELALRENLNIHMGETLYYINIGTSKSHSDVKRVTHYYVTDGLYGEKSDRRVALEREWKRDAVDGKMAPEGQSLKFKEYVRRHHPEVLIEDEVVLNCRLIPESVINSETDTFCSEGEEYNVPKYISQFNSRIKPLLVCFRPEIRDKILIDSPDSRPYFTEEECELCSGLPNKPSDQDTYEELMTMEDREIAFWLSHPEWEPPYLKECGMDWDEIVRDYKERKRREEELGISEIRKAFNDILNSMDSSDFEKFEEGVLPSAMTRIVEMDPSTGAFMAKKYPDIRIGTIHDILDAEEEYYTSVESNID